MAMRLARPTRASRLLLWSGVVLVVLAINGHVSAHEAVPHQQGISVHASAASTVDYDADSGGRESANGHKCRHHSSGGCGAPWAFLSAEGTLPIAGSIAWIRFGRTVHEGGTSIPLDHPPKAGFAH